MGDVIEINVQSWKPRIQINSRWTENGCRFRTREAALQCAELVGTRLAFNTGAIIGKCAAAPSDDPPNQDDD